VHEGGIYSPFIVHCHKGIQVHGELRHTPCHFIDILPTLLELCDLPVSSNRKGQPTPPLAGRSLRPALMADVEIPREFLFFHHQDNRAIRVGDWKLVAAGKGQPWELYDMRTDRSEMVNLAAQRPLKARQLAELWETKEREFRELAELEEWSPEK
ncbi:MAG: sulfatase/phosphatase domain-containing protein, partial [Candidatus Zipacnadales bacterium]